MNLNVVRNITITSTPKGLDETTGKLQKLAGAQDNVAKVSERSAKSTLSVDRALERHQRTLDVNYRATQQLANVQRDLDRARNQGLITQTRQNELMALAAARHGQAATATGVHSAALTGLNARLATTATLLKGALLANLGLAGGVGALSLLAGGPFIKATIEQEKVQAQLESAIRSTGGAAGLTSAQLLEMATGMQRVTNFGDEAVVSAQALLLTFTRIGREVFPQAVEAILNVSTAMDQGIKESAVQIGKALNDPIKGLTALQRVGIQFTQSQREQITTAVEAGNVLEAQRVILRELEVQFGGSARAARETLGGAFTSLTNALGDLFEVQANSTGNFREEIERLTAFLSSPSTQAAVQGFGAWIFSAITVTLQGASIAMRKFADDVRLLQEMRLREFVLPTPRERAETRLRIGSGEGLSNNDAASFYDAVGIAADKAAGGVRKFGAATDEAGAQTERQARKLEREAEFIRRSNEQRQTRLDALTREGAAMGMAGEEVLALQLREEELARARERNIQLTPEQVRSIDEWAAAYAKLKTEIEQTQAIARGFEQASSAFISPFLSAMAQGKSAVEALRAGLEGVGNTLQSIGSQMISRQLGNLFSGRGVDVSQIGAGASLALIGTAVSGILNLQEARERRREELREQRDRAAIASRERLEALRERSFLSGLDPSTEAGELAAFDFRAQREISPFGQNVPGGKGGPGGEELALLEQALANERAAIVKKFADRAIEEEKRRVEEIERLRLDFLDREFAATNDASTLEGALLAFDRAAARERIEIASSAAELLPDLERALAAERLAIQREFAEDSTEDLRRMFEDASNFLIGFRHDIDQFIAHFNAGPQSLLSPVDRLASATASFNSQYALALTGDRTALSGITSAGSDLAEAARAVWGSTATGENIIQQMLTQLAALPDLITPEDLVVAAIEDAAATNDAALADLIALMDANGDGIVTEIEKLEFIRQHTFGTQGNTSATITRIEQSIDRLDTTIARLQSQLDVMGAHTTRFDTSNTLADIANDILEALQGFINLMHQNTQTITEQSGFLNTIAGNTRWGWAASGSTASIIPGTQGTPASVEVKHGGGWIGGAGEIDIRALAGEFMVRREVAQTNPWLPAFNRTGNVPNNRELIAEVMALRSEVAALRQATLAGASHVREGVDEGNKIAADTNRKARRDAA